MGRPIIHALMDNDKVLRFLVSTLVPLFCKLKGISSNELNYRVKFFLVTVLLPFFILVTNF